MTLDENIEVMLNLDKKNVESCSDGVMKIYNFVVETTLKSKMKSYKPELWEDIIGAVHDVGINGGVDNEDKVWIEAKSLDGSIHQDDYNVKDGDCGQHEWSWIGR